MKKTTQSLSSASGSKMIIKYKLDNVHVCNEGICISTQFLLVRNLFQAIILGTPFILEAMSLEKIDSSFIFGNHQGHKVIFEFITKPQKKVINEIESSIILK